LKRLYLQVHQPELAGKADEGQVTRLEEGATRSACWPSEGFRAAQWLVSSVG